MVKTVLLILLILGGGSALAATKDEGVSTVTSHRSYPELYPSLFTGLMEEEARRLEQYQDKFSSYVWELANEIAFQKSSQNVESVPQEVSKKIFENSLSYLVLLYGQFSRHGVTQSVIDEFGRLINTRKVLYLYPKKPKKFQVELEFYGDHKNRELKDEAIDSESEEGGAEKKAESINCDIGVSIDQIIGALIKLDETDLHLVVTQVVDLLERFGPALCYAGLFDPQLLQLLPQAMPIIEHLKRDVKETITYRMGLFLILLKKISPSQRNEFVKAVLSKFQEQEIRGDIFDLAKDIAFTSYGIQSAHSSPPRGFNDMISGIYLAPLQIKWKPSHLNSLLESLVMQSDFIGSSLKTAWMARQLIKFGYKEGVTSPHRAGQMFKVFMEQKIGAEHLASGNRFEHEADRFARLIEEDLSSAHSVLLAALKKQLKKPKKIKVGYYVEHKIVPEYAFYKKDA